MLELVAVDVHTEKLGVCRKAIAEWPGELFNGIAECGQIVSDRVFSGTGAVTYSYYWVVV